MRLEKGNNALALPDLTVAAIAISNGLQLATDNSKDFPMPELRFYPLP
jgi:predicted nucleic acid-binding protein